MPALSTLTPNEVLTVEIAMPGLDEFEVVTDGMDEVFYAIGYGGVRDPGVDDGEESTFWLPAAASARTHTRKGRGAPTVVKIVSPGAPRVAVQVLR